VMQFLALDGLLDGGLKFRPMTLPDRFIDHGRCVDVTCYFTVMCHLAGEASLLWCAACSCLPSSVRCGAPARFQLHFAAARVCILFSTTSFLPRAPHMLTRFAACLTVFSRCCRYEDQLAEPGLSASQCLHPVIKISSLDTLASNADIACCLPRLLFFVAAAGMRTSWLRQASAQATLPALHWPPWASQRTPSSHCPASAHDAAAGESSRGLMQQA
jgi:hypothetical protein